MLIKMNKDIQTLIEMEAEESVQIFPEDQRVSRAMKRVGKRKFIQGASFALSLFKWRKVSEVLPEQDSSLLEESGRKTYKGRMEKLGTVKTKPVLVKYADGSCVLACRCQCKGDDYYWWDCHESFDKNDFMYITEWMPIPQID